MLLSYVCSPEAMGLVTGCIFLVTLFLFIPIPFGNSWLKDNTFPQDEVSGWISRFLVRTEILIPTSKHQVYRTYCCTAVHLLHDFAGLRRWRSQSAMETQALATNDCQPTAADGLLRQLQFDYRNHAEFHSWICWHIAGHWYAFNRWNDSLEHNSYSQSAHFCFDCRSSLLRVHGNVGRVLYECHQHIGWHQRIGSWPIDRYCIIHHTVQLYRNVQR